jgi:GNAT superfamily N-acetyltransferase
MTDLHIRPARLEDANPISLLARAGISAWQRADAAGSIRDVPYESLSIYERWLHGGSWMSVEMAILHLNHLLVGGGMPFVAEAEGQVVGYAEVYPGAEPAPFGDHLHIGQMLVASGGDEAIGDALIIGLREAAKALKLPRLTACCASGDAPSAALYARHGMGLIATVQRMTLPARAGQGFYKVSDHPDPNPAQIKGWQMPVGRVGSARQQWEQLWPRTLQAVPEIAGRQAKRIQMMASGQEAFVYCEERLYAPRQAELSLWAPRQLSGQLLTALRDWCHKEGYRTLVLTMTEEGANVLGTEGESDGYQLEVYGGPV